MLLYFFKNQQRSLLVDIILQLVVYRRQPHDFKTCLLGRGFYKKCFVSPLTNVGSHNLPLRSSIFTSIPSPTSLLAYRSMFDSDTIGNDPSPLLVDIVRFNSLCITVVSNQCGISQSGIIEDIVPFTDYELEKDL